MGRAGLGNDPRVHELHLLISVAESRDWGDSLIDIYNRDLIVSRRLGTRRTDQDVSKAVPIEIAKVLNIPAG